MMVISQLQIACFFDYVFIFCKNVLAGEQLHTTVLLSGDKVPVP